MWENFPHHWSFPTLWEIYFHLLGIFIPSLFFVFPEWGKFSDKRIFVSQNVGIFPRCGNRFPSLKYIIFPPKFPAFLGYSLARSSKDPNVSSNSLKNTLKSFQISLGKIKLFALFYFSKFTCSLRINLKNR